MENWNDDRLDELSRRVDEGFKEAATKVEMNHRFDEVHRTMKAGFEGVNREFDEVNRELHGVSDRLDKLFYGVGFVGLTIGLNIVADKV